MKKTLYILFLAALMFLFSCENVFEYSPYEADVASKYENTHEKSANLLLSQGENRKKFSAKIVIIADSHYHFEDLRDAVNKINKLEDVDFVIHAGDLTDQGLKKEFEWFHNTMSDLKKPYFTVIGNHDFRSNGEKIYGQMFGAKNYSVIFNNYKFIFFNNTFWENSKTPDFDWFENECKSSGENAGIITISHIPPCDEQFTAEKREMFKKIQRENNVMLSIHGHLHNYEKDSEPKENLQYLITGTVKNRQFCIFTLDGDKNYSLETIKF